MKKFVKISLVFTLANIAAINYVAAQSLLPSFMQELIDNWEGTSTTDKITGLVRLALTLAFGVVILIAVAFSIIAAIKYIRSQGDAGQVEEANKAIKAIFQGVAMMFVGIIGVILVFFVFEVAIPDPSLPNVCVQYPESIGCRICSEGTEKDGVYTLDGEEMTEKECNEDVPPSTKQGPLIV